MKKQIAIRLEEEDIRDLKIYAIENNTTLQALAEECLLNLIKEEGKMKIWERDGYIVEEREFDYDLHRLSVIVDGVELYEIIPSDIDNMKDMMEELDNGADVEGWEDGQGNTIRISR